MKRNIWKGKQYPVNLESTVKIGIYCFRQDNNKDKPIKGGH